jgi:phosphoribosylamine--glycine ligase
MTPMLAAGGYCGYINLNTIVNQRGIWPLEFTCRFGYPGFAVLGPLQQTRWGELFEAMTGRKGNATMLPGFCAAIVLTTPPFPYDRETVKEATVGLPVMFDGGLSEQDQDRLYYGEVGVVNGQLVTSGMYGWTMVATAVADSVDEARYKASELADRIIAPNVRYRRDIGSALVERDFAFVEDLGFFDPVGDPSTRATRNK